MSLCNCNCRCRCTLAAVIVSAIIGIVTAFLQITGVITVTAAFLWVAFGIAVVGLGVLVLAAALLRRVDRSGCQCTTLNALLAGLLGTILFAVVLLAFGVTATSVISAILVGLLLFSFTLALTGTACLIRNLANCDE